MLTPREIKDAFINCKLEENYNFLEEDLVKLANAFVTAAEPKITKKERDRCVKIARSLNKEVAKVLEEVK
jgi:hypothetical protein